MFRTLVFGPVLLGILLAITGAINSSTGTNWTFSGFNTFIELFKLPIGVASVSIPLGALVASHHRSIQSARQINLQDAQNTFSNYVKHREYFGKFLEDENLLNGDSSFKATGKSIYTALFPNSQEGELEARVDLNYTFNGDYILDLTVSAVNKVSWSNTSKLPTFLACLDELAQGIGDSFHLYAPLISDRLDIESALHECRKIANTLDDIYSAALFLTPSQSAESLKDWSKKMTTIIARLIGVRRFELAEQRIIEIASTSQTGTLNEEQRDQVLSLLGGHRKAKLGWIFEKHQRAEQLAPIVDDLKKRRS